MKMSIKKIAALILGVGLLGTLAACGHHRYNANPEEHAAYMVKKITEELTLDDNQVAKLELVKTELLAMRQEMKSKREQTISAINEMLDQSTLDQQRILNMVTDHTTTINQKAPQIVAVLGDFYDSLTTDQQAKLHKEVNERMEHHGKFWHH